MGVMGGVSYSTTTTRAADERPNVLFVLGPPGAGKGTNCEKLVEHYGYYHISAGDCLREERKNPNSKDGELINTYIKEGKIVPVEITIALMLRKATPSPPPPAELAALIDRSPRMLLRRCRCAETVLFVLCHRRWTSRWLSGPQAF